MNPTIGTFLALLALAAVLNQCDACSCIPAHPQDQFCKADFGKYPRTTPVQSINYLHNYRYYCYFLPLLLILIVLLLLSISILSLSLLNSYPGDGKTGIRPGVFKDIQGENTQGVQDVGESEGGVETRPPAHGPLRFHVWRHPRHPKDLLDHRTSRGRAAGAHQPVRPHEALVRREPQAEEGLQAALRPGVRLQGELRA